MLICYISGLSAAHSALGPAYPLGHLLPCLPTQDDGLASTFKNKAKAIQALETGVVLLDRSHWGRLRLAGNDRLNFLQNQSTADFRSLKPGQGCDTVSMADSPLIAPARACCIHACLLARSGRVCNQVG